MSLTQSKNKANGRECVVVYSIHASLNNSVSLKNVFEERCSSPVQDRTRDFWCWSELHYQLSQILHNLMAVLAYTLGFSALVWMNTGMFRLIKIYSEVPEDSALISSKSRFDRCWHCWDSGVTVRQTDRWLFSFI